MLKQPDRELGLQVSSLGMFDLDRHKEKEIYWNE